MTNILFIILVALTFSLILKKSFLKDNNLAIGIASAVLTVITILLFNAIEFIVNLILSFFI